MTANPTTASNDTATHTEAKAYDLSNYLATLQAQMPKDADAAEYYKAKMLEAEQRRRATVAGFTKSQQELKVAQAQAAYLNERVASSIKLTDQQKEELEALKITDPDKWRATLNTYEAQAHEASKAEIKEKLAQLEAMSVEQFKKEKIAHKVKQFVAKNPDLDITKQETLDLIPSVYIKKLERDEMDIDEFLVVAKKFLTADSITTSVKTPDTEGADISQIRGSSTQPNSYRKPNYMNETF